MRNIGQWIKIWNFRSECNDTSETTRISVWTDTEKTESTLWLTLKSPKYVYSAEFLIERESMCVQLWWTFDPSKLQLIKKKSVPLCALIVEWVMTWKLLMTWIVTKICAVFVFKELEEMWSRRWSEIWTLVSEIWTHSSVICSQYSDFRSLRTYF